MTHLRLNRDSLAGRGQTKLARGRSIPTGTRVAIVTGRDEQGFGRIRITRGARERERAAYSQRVSDGRRDGLVGAAALDEALVGDVLRRNY